MKIVEPTVFVVDDDESVCRSLRELIATVGFNVRTFGSALEFIDSYDPVQPSCVVLDVRMPGMSGLGLQRKLARCGGRLPIVFITGYGDVPTATEAMKNGAVDFIEKPFSEQKLLESINKAVQASLSIHRHQAEIDDIQERLNSLTSRERQILEGIVDGKTNKAIAVELNLSPKTVDFHRCNIMEKMGVNNVVQLTKKVMKASASEAPALSA